MILSKQDYRKYVKSDEEAFNISTKGLRFKVVFYLKCYFYSERYILLSYLKVLRKLEYLYNVRNKNIYDKFLYIYYFRKIRKKSINLQINIPINTLKEGALILHIGTIVINDGARIGKNCILQPGVIIGQKDLKENVPVIGDNVYFGPGAMVIGKVNIGNNVIIAPNTVVIKDVANNCVVSGVPAKVIKQDGLKVSYN
ncbi:serine acetyltransferase [Flavobacterium sp. LC2016-01]|uniref:serine O-acetyltransferase n=1 Tax=Flavobacterium sp. LC2016-01 TaxID=2675876 RepID=UPI0012BA91A4|nr:serine acetyltransferase [Flavobacterium sp. LC2016-01]MTH18080.1 serine acetyltransferase [Flavobacterium sp. LC2016-01]